MEKKYIIIGVILIIIVAIVFYIIGYSYGKKASQADVDYYKKVIESTSSIPQKIFNITGSITKIENNILEVEVLIKDKYKLQDEWEKTIIKVNVDNETKIFEVTPGQIENEEVELFNLKIGDRITANSNTEITGKKEFTASTIFVTNASE